MHVSHTNDPNRPQQSTKQDSSSCSTIALSNLRFEYFCTAMTLKKFSAHSWQDVPPHLEHVRTLPGETVKQLVNT